MSSPRIRTSHQYGEVYPNVWSDFDWVHEHRKELLEQYGEGVVLVYQKQVIGFGSTFEEAEADAERRLPPDVSEITPIIQYLRHRHPLFRIRPTPVPPEHD